MESRTLPRPLRAVAERGHPRHAAASGRRNRLEPEELQDRVPVTGESREVEVPLEGLVAREPTPVRSARAWAPPGEREVARAVLQASSFKLHAHTRVFERREAGANATIQVPLCDPGPGALGCKPVLGLASCRFIFSINSRRNRWLAGRE